MGMTLKGPRATRRDHAWIDERSRALHARVAEKLRADPTLISIARENITRWEQLRGPDPALDEWKALIRRRKAQDLVQLLTEHSENADRMRQSSPFAGILTPEERLAVLRHYETL